MLRRQPLQAGVSAPSPSRRNSVLAAILSLSLGAVIFGPRGVAQELETHYRGVLLAIQQRIEEKDFDGARMLLSAAKTEFPMNGGVENLFGVVEVEQGHPDRAALDFQAAIKHSPDLTSAYLNLGQIYMQNDGAGSAALQTYEGLLRRDSRNSEANYQVATLLMRDREHQRSLNHLARLGEGDRAKIGALILLCADEAALHHGVAADKAASAIVAAPDLTEEDAMAALPALRLGRRADLIDSIFTAVNNKVGLSAKGLRVLGLAQEGEGKLVEARATLELAFERDSTSVLTLVDLTRVAKASKDYAGALGYLAHARDLQPNDASFAYEFGVLTIRMGLLGEARKAMGEAVRLAPENPEYNFGMGTVSSFSQDATQGLPYLQKYHALRPSDPAALLSIGTAYFRAKDFPASTSWLEQAVIHKATAADAHYYLGRIGRVEGRLDVAKRELEQADVLEPNRADVLAELGEVFVATRDYPKAGVYLERAVLIEPENYAANFGLLQLYAREGDARKEQQAKRFDMIKSKSEEQYQEMMRVIDARADKVSGS